MVKNIILFLFLLAASFCFPQILNGQQFNFQNYSVGEGLAQSQVYAILQDRQGYIWLGTQGGGVSRFDGKNFHQYSVNNGLVNNYVEALFEDAEGNIWIGTQQGFSRFDGKQFTNFHHPEHDFISAFAQEPLGKIWVGTRRGTYQFDGEKFTDFTLPSSRVTCFFYDQKDNLWIGTTENGAYQIRDNQLLQNFTLADGLINNHVAGITQDDSGNLIFANYNGGLNVYNGRFFSYYREEEGLSSNLITSIFKNKNEEYWIGTQNAGVNIWNRENTANNTFTFLNDADGLANNHVKNIIKDHWGNFWIGTSGGGVSKYSGQQFIHFNKKNGLAGNQVYAIANDSLGNFWLGNGAKGVAYFDGKNFKNYGATEGFSNVKTKAILVDNANRVWLGTDGKGLAVFAEGRFRFYSVEDGLGGRWVRDVVQDKQGRIWVATSDGGITRIEIFKSRVLPSPSLGGGNDSLENSPSPPVEDYLTFKKFRKGNYGLASNRITDLHLDKKNRIWFATDNNGIGFFQNDSTVFTFNRQDGLLDNRIRSLTEDTAGNLWIGTASQGICRMKIYENELQPKAFINPENQNLASLNIYSLALDAQQNLWVGSEIGVDKISFDESRKATQIKHFGKSEGFVGIETCQNSVLRDSSGNMWFGTMNGLTKYNPASIYNNTISPILNITSVQLNYQDLENTEFKNFVNPHGGLLAGLTLPYDKNDLEFEFQGINLSNPDKVTYQWKLEGLSEAWTPLRTRNFATFPQLPPNDYTFKLRAFNEDGVGNETPLEMSFTISPPVWQTWWFRIVSVLLLIALVAWFIKNKIERVRRKAAREQERLELEKHLLGLEQKALQLQMNPHFIFNALNSIQSLISQKDNKTARYQLAKFSKLMRSILENSRSQTISLEDEISTLQNYLAIEKSSRGNTFDFDFHVDENIDPEEVSIPPMMLQPFVENAIIHGVAHLSEKGKIEIHFAQKGKILECVITDNGIGREAAKAIKSQIAEQHKSAALEVTQERLDILNVDFQHQKSLEFIDLADVNGKAQGTKVVVRLPIVVSDWLSASR